jgi:hypothetical protein
MFPNPLGITAGAINYFNKKSSDPSRVSFVKDFLPYAMLGPTLGLLANKGIDIAKDRINANEEKEQQQLSPLAKKADKLRREFDWELKKIGFRNRPEFKDTKLYYGDGIRAIGYGFENLYSEATEKLPENDPLRNDLQTLSHNYGVRFDKEIDPYIKEDEAKNGVQFHFGGLIIS